MGGGGGGGMKLARGSDHKGTRGDFWGQKICSLP